MYETKTFETILQGMLSRVPNSLDKREGSIIYDALAPAAAELAQAYIQLDFILDQTFADTASREFLIKRTKERDMAPDPATSTILKGEFAPASIDVLNKRFNLGDLNYTVIELIEAGVYKVQCETAGAVGNQALGDLIPIDYIAGLASAALTEVLVPGEDEEDTEVFRTRYFASFADQAFGGNIADYLEKTNAIAGVGSTKVTPVWNGGGTVKLTILNSAFDKASAELIADVQELIDPAPQGEGWGLAPVGHVVTVDTATEVTLNINTVLTFNSGYSWDTVASQARAAIEAYLLEQRQAWANQSSLIIRIAQIEARLLTITGILDVANTTINSSGSNLTLTAYQIPVLGSVTA
jgi:uncharacterized phage protein gp47/JayE